jgi:hypothetical protein
MTPEQFDSTWRMSKALAKSGSFKDIRAGLSGRDGEARWRSPGSCSAPTSA